MKWSTQHLRLRSHIRKHLAQYTECIRYFQYTLHFFNFCLAHHYAECTNANQWTNILSYILGKILLEFDLSTLSWLEMINTTDDISLVITSSSLKCSQIGHKINLKVTQTKDWEKKSVKFLFLRWVHLFCNIVIKLLSLQYTQVLVIHLHSPEWELLN